MPLKSDTPDTDKQYPIDPELQEAIDRLYTLVSRSNELETLYLQLLEEMCAISGAPVGVVVDVDIQSTTERFQVNALRHTQGCDTGFDLPITPSEDLNFLEEVVSSGREKVFLSPSLTKLDFKRLNWPMPHQMLAIPLLDGVNVYAIACMVNSEKPFDAADITARCWPLLTSATCIRRAMRPKADRYDNDEWCKTLLQVEQINPMAMICIDSQHQIARVNPAAEKLFGVSKETCVGNPINTLLPERFPNEHRLKTFAAFGRHDIKREPRVLLGKCRNKVTPVEVTPVRYRSDSSDHLLLMIRDNTEVEQVRDEMKEQSQRFKAVSDLAPIGILRTNANWEAVYVNDRWCEICHTARSEVMGAGWIKSIFFEDVSELLTNLRNNMLNAEEFKASCRLQTPLGETVWCEIQARPLYDATEKMIGFIATLVDVTYHRMTEEKLRNMAERDSLTGLANRALFQDRLEHALQRVDRHGPIALLFIDLDGFKNVNDTLGHDAGDDLLVDVAHRLLHSVRNEDTVARVGGDEFTILLEGLHDASVAAEISEKILATMQEPFNLGDQEVFISTSIGITFANDSTQANPQSIIKQADIALYRAKAEGRNNYQYFSPHLEEASRIRLSLSNSLHRALERSEFEVFYQLQASIGSNEVVGCEALLRWRHSKKGLLPPDQFISLLEETGLIATVSRWVWFEAFNAFKSWMNTGAMPENGHISINLSPQQLRDTQLTHNLESAIREAGIDASHVIVEITESALLDESATTVKTLKDIKELGIKLALDDFGTGYSSLTYLKRCAIDIIKIDKTFIRDLLKDPEDAAITRAVIALAESLKITCVAEGVDAYDKLQELAKWDCATYQGFLLNQPMPAPELLRLLSDLKDPEKYPALTQAVHP